MVQLIDLFILHGYSLFFGSAAVKNEYSLDLAARGVEEIQLRLNSQSFDCFIHGLEPEIVIFDRFMTEEQFGWRTAKNSPDSLRILDTEDLHLLRHGRELALKEYQEFDDAGLFNEIAKREIASIYRCELSLIISEFEMELLKNNFRIPRELLLYLPLLIDKKEIQTEDELPPFELRDNFVFIGNFLHAPNKDAVLYLSKEIWPSIHEKLPGVEAHIYGAYMPQQIKQLDNAESGFLTKGRAARVKDVMQHAKVNLAPLRFGAGLKGKLIESMIWGTPCITTPIGAEGINGGLSWPGKIVEKPGEFALAAVELYRNKHQWTEAQKAGLNLIKERFDKQPFEDEFINRLQQLGMKLKEHRRSNFTGSMLLHHTMASSRFMGKWIEEKNKK